MDTAQWPQIVVKPIEEIIVTNTKATSPTSALDQRKVTRPQKEEALNCPRCNSTNTKFCYYNNYSRTQPRYFCKTCRRYWTEGGSLRNIPVGGGSRKNKRSSSLPLPSSSSSSISSFSNNKKLPDLVTQPQNPNKIHEAQDLNLAFPYSTHIRTFSDLIPSIGNNKNNQVSSTTTPPQLSALELLTGVSSRGLNYFMPVQVQDPNPVCNTSGFSLQDFKPTLSFTLDGVGRSSNGGYENNLHGVQESSGNGRLLFPFEDLKQVSSTTEIEQHKEHGDSAGYWTGMLSGGSW